MIERTCHNIHSHPCAVGQALSHSALVGMAIIRCTQPCTLLDSLGHRQGTHTHSYCTLVIAMETATGYKVQCLCTNRAVPNPNHNMHTVECPRSKQDGLVEAATDNEDKQVHTTVQYVRMYVCCHQAAYTCVHTHIHTHTHTYCAVVMKVPALIKVSIKGSPVCTVLVVPLTPLPPADSSIPKRLCTRRAK